MKKWEKFIESKYAYASQGQLPPGSDNLTREMIAAIEKVETLIARFYISHSDPNFQQWQRLYTSCEEITNLLKQGDLK